ncbi:hypothetical protein N9T98_00105 [bacterium]|nr:hypothetical protein [bacterium]
MTPFAKAGCGTAEGLMQICYKGSCEVQKLARQCSSVVAGNQYESERGYLYGYSEYIGGRATQMIVEFTPHNKVLYSGDPDRSPYKFDICGSRFTGGPCSAKLWAR